MGLQASEFLRGQCRQKMVLLWSMQDRHRIPGTLQTSAGMESYVRLDTDETAVLINDAYAVLLCRIPVATAEYASASMIL
jgi:hypothetical protein